MTSESTTDRANPCVACGKRRSYTLFDRLRRRLLDDDPQAEFPEVWIPDAATEQMGTLFGSYEIVRR